MKLSACKGCGATILWGKDIVSNATVPIDLKASVYFVQAHKNGEVFITKMEKMHDDQRSETQIGYAVSHFSTCPNASDFSAGKKKEGK